MVVSWRTAVARTGATAQSCGSRYTYVLKAGLCIDPPGVPGHDAALTHSCEYASRVTKSATFGKPPECGSAWRAKERVDAMSKLPHQQCGRLRLQRKSERNSFNTRSPCTVPWLRTRDRNL